MAKQSITMTTNTTSRVATLRQIAGNASSNKTTVQFYGTFGSGTLTFSLSPNGGTSQIPIKAGPNGTDAAISHTADGQFVIDANLNTGATAMELYATLTGSSGASVVIDVIEQTIG